MVRKADVKHLGPQQKRVIDNDVILLRKIDPRKMASLMAQLKATQLAPNEPEGDMPWFVDNYVACEHPRSMDMSKALLDATVGYAIARVDTGEILMDVGPSNKDYQKAYDISQNVTVENAISVALGKQASAEE